MGDKLAAKRLHGRAPGVPVLPSWEVTGGHAARCDGVPLPVHGEGRRGRRRQGHADRRRAAADLGDAVAAARREAGAAFGDRHGVRSSGTSPRPGTSRSRSSRTASAEPVHCFERECSIQRRHQKIIEECPSPALDAGLRDRMGAAALAAAEAVGYLGAGHRRVPAGALRGRFWFLEINTRLQVEHPVTEAVTGIDLVREQLLVAQGLPLSVTQAGLAINGHAIEARLYAEDPAAGFLPATGTLLDWCPAADPPCRWDSGVAAGSVVGIEFDPLLAKVIAHAPTRAEAALRLALALERSRIRGVVSNRDFLVAALRHPDFLAGRATTAFIELAGSPAPASSRPRRTADRGRGRGPRRAGGTRAAAPVLATMPSGWRNTVMPAGAGRVPARRRHRGGAATGASVTAGSPSGQRPGAGQAVSPVPEASPAVAGVPPDAGQPPTRRCMVDGHQRRRWLDGLRGGGAAAPAARVPPRRPGVGPGPGGRRGAGPRCPASRSAEREAVAGGLVAPMPGTVLAVHVAAGDTVAEGQLLMIVEAMKMEHRITAPPAGVVARESAPARRPGQRRRPAGRDREAESGIMTAAPLRIANCSGFYGDRLRPRPGDGRRRAHRRADRRLARRADHAGAGEERPARSGRRLRPHVRDPDGTGHGRVPGPRDQGGVERGRAGPRSGAPRRCRPSPPSSAWIRSSPTSRATT